MSSGKRKISGTVLFRETQQFRVQWLWWLIILCVVSSIGLIVGLAFTEQETRADSWIALAFVVPLEAGMLYLFYIVKLETVVSDEGVFYKWGPFFSQYNFIAVTDIAQVTLRKGPSLSYGFHLIPGYGTVHNTGPGKGIQFVLKNDKKIFIGTQKLNNFQSAIESIIGFKNLK